MKKKKTLVVVLIVVLLAFTSALVGCNDKVENFTITYSLNYTDAVAPTTVTFVAGDKITVPAEPTREGYSFEGWYLDAAGSEIMPNDKTATASITLYANWAKFNNVTYNLGYETTQLPPKATSEKTGANFVTAKAPSRENYAFVGWSFGDGENDFVLAGSTYKIANDGDVAFKAKWAINTFIVTFKDFNGIVLKSENVKFGSAAIAPEYNEDDYEYKKHYELVWSCDFNNITSELVVTLDYNYMATADTYFTFTEVTNNEEPATVVGYTIAGTMKDADGGVVTYPNNTVLPKEYNGLPIIGFSGTSSRDGAFRGNTKIINVYVPDTYTKIPAYAFYKNTTLKEVELVNGITTIDKNAFEGCLNLETINFPNTLENIGVQAFLGNAKLVYNFELGGTAPLTIQEYAFAPKTGTSFSNSDVKKSPMTTNVKFPARLEEIGKFAFTVSKFESIVFEDSLTNLVIRQKAFQKLCSMPTTSTYENPLATLILPNGLTTIETYAFSGLANKDFVNTKLTTLTIPGSVTKIDGDCFSYYNNVETLTFADSDLDLVIGSCAFQCYSNFPNNTLTTLNIPKRVVDIGMNAFSQYNKLATVNFATGSRLKNIGNIPFDDSAILSITLPNSVESIGSYLKGTKADGDSIKEGAEGMEITLPNSIKKINSNAFADMNIKSINMPTSLTTIGSRAFNETKGLKSITIPTTIEEIDNYAFAEMPDLTSVTFVKGGTKPLTIGEGAFAGKIMVLGSYADVSGSVTVTKQNLSAIELPARLSSIGNNAFSYTNITAFTMEAPPATVVVKYTIVDGNLTNGEGTLVAVAPAASGAITLGDSITKIGQNAFSGCTEITSVDTNKVTTIGAKAFEKAVGLTTINLQNSTLEISNYANTFFNCRSLTTVTFGATTTIAEIPGSAFKNCFSLTSITLPDSVTTLGKECFINTGITSYTMPETIVNMGEGVFKDCHNLAVFNFNSTIKVLNNELFSGCIRLKSIEFPAQLEKINTGTSDYNAFLKDAGKSLASTETFTATFAAGYKLTAVPAFLFANSTIKSIILPECTTVINKGAFKGTKLESISIPESVTKIETDAFAKIDDLTFTINHADNLDPIDLTGTIFTSGKTINVYLPSYALLQKYLVTGYWKSSYDDKLFVNPANLTVTDTYYNLDKNGVLVSIVDKSIAADTVKITLPNAVNLIGATALNDLPTTVKTICITALLTEGKPSVKLDSKVVIPADIKFEFSTKAIRDAYFADTEWAKLGAARLTVTK